MSDCIWIEGLTGRTFVGVEDWEQRDRQEVRIRIRLTADLNAAGQSDRLEDTVNYRSVAKRTLALVEGSRFNLVEHLADSVASMILAEFPRVVSVSLRVEKPGALRFAESVGVEVERRR
jgi:FolB domain-containing protein